MWESGLPDFRVGGPAGSRWNPGVQKGSHEQDLALGKSRVQACEGGDFLHPLPSALPSFPMVGTRGCVSVRQHSAAELRHCVPSAELRLALNSWFFCFLLFSTGLPDCHPSHHDQSHCAYRAVPPPPEGDTHLPGDEDTETVPWHWIPNPDRPHLLQPEPPDPNRPSPHNPRCRAFFLSAEEPSGLTGLHSKAREKMLTGRDSGSEERQSRSPSCGLQRTSPVSGGCLVRETLLLLQTLP